MVLSVGGRGRERSKQEFRAIFKRGSVLEINQVVGREEITRYLLKPQLKVLVSKIYVI